MQILQVFLLKHVWSPGLEGKTESSFLSFRLSSFPHQAIQKIRLSFHIEVIIDILQTEEKISQTCRDTESKHDCLCMYQSS